MKRSPIGPRKKEMDRGGELKRGGPLQAKKGLTTRKPLSPGKGLVPGKGLSSMAKSAPRSEIKRTAKPKPASELKRKTEKRPRTRKSEAPFRHAVLAAYGKACKVCGSLTWVQAAHIWSKGQGGPTIEENGVPLCRPHHEDYDQYRLQMRYEWLAPNQLAWLATSGYATWDEDGQPIGRGARRFAPMTNGQVARRRERKSA